MKLKNFKDVVFPSSSVYIDHVTNTSWSWEDLYKKSKRRILSIPVKNFDNKIVGISGDNGIETLLDILSVLFNNGIPAPFPPGYKDNTYNQCMKNLKAAAWKENKKWKSTENGLKHVDGFDFVVHSSGSTGVPKPLAITLSSMARNSLDFSKMLEIDNRDIHIGGFSQCYMSGLYNQTLLPMLLGCKTIGVPTTTPKTLHILLDAIKKYRPSVLWINPLIARSLANLRSIPEDLFVSFRFAISCTAHLSNSDKELFEKRFKVPLLESYGLCETLINTVEKRGISTKKNTAGCPIGQKNEIIIDDDGQIAVQNGSVFCGVLDPIPLEPVKSLENYKTGDLGYFNKDGNLVITGRLSEVINRNGIKISPEYIESVINSIEGVSESSIIGFKDDIHDVRIVALIASAEKEASMLHSILREKLTIVERPHEIIVVGSLPKIANGKLDRRLLYKMYNDQEFL